MARRRVSKKREITPDPVFNNVVVSKFINTLMQNGKKSIAEKILYSAIEQISRRLGSGQKNEEQAASSSVDKNAEALKMVLQAIENVAPMVEVKAKRIGGSTYQIPVEVRPSRRLALAMRWIIDAAKKRAGKSMAKKLFDELMDAAKGLGAAFKKKEETHRMAKSNQVYAHVRTS